MNSLDNAVLFDIESFPNVFTLSMEMLKSPERAVWEISDYRNDAQQLMQWLQYLAKHQIFMIGFRSLGYDYPLIHWWMQNPSATAQQIKAKSDEIINSQDRFGHNIWANKRFIPQIDLAKVHHLDNVAKMQSLKGLQINMRSPNVVEFGKGFDECLTEQEVNQEAIPYNDHDVSETKKFAHHSMVALEFRLDLIPEYGIEVMNWNDTKIGEEIMIKRLGQDLCFDTSSGYKQKRQTPRTQIVFNDIIFPYVRFDNPEFQKVLDTLKSTTLRADEVDIDEDGTPSLKTKGVFKNLKAIVGGVEFGFGVGGIHGSVERKKILSTGDYIIKDIDVAQQYPQIAIQNNLAPAHLGQPFCAVYAELPVERKKAQVEFGKKSVKANSLKLAANGVYGKSNSKFSVFFDPQFTMTITVNGQLMLAMLVEKLALVPTLSLIQANTDGITFYIRKDYEPHADAICRQWEQITNLVLEDAYYNRMFVRDVNNYIAEDADGDLKLKGAYWAPDAMNWHESISNAQPPAWHKNLSNPVSIRAAVAHMIHGVDIETFIRSCTNPYDFVNQVKIKGKDKLFHGQTRTQKNTRFYISNDGEELTKQMPSLGPIGQPRKTTKASWEEYNAVMLETGNRWDERVCVKDKKAVYDLRNNKIASGYKTTLINNIEHFRFDNINIAWYVNEAQKLVV